MSECLDMFETLTKNAGDAGVLVTVARVRGSGPREVGAQMWVTADSIQGTIGGGNFEYNAIDLARELLSDNDEKPVVQEYPLGPALGQCCGGVVTLLLEPMTDALAKHMEQAANIAANGDTAISIVDLETPASRMLLADGIVPARASGDVAAKGAVLVQSAGEICQTYKADSDTDYLMQVVRKDKTPLYIYGAGHVGRALVNAILPLSFDIHWVDVRADEFPSNVAALPLIQHITDNPVAIANATDVDAFHIVLTYDHQIDFDICEALLRKDEYGYLGMIGSDTKRARFVRRFRNRGINEEQIDRFICPIGISDVTSKRPAEIAISVAAEIIQHQARNRDAAKNVQSDNRKGGVCIS